MRRAGIALLLLSLAGLVAAIFLSQRPEVPPLPDSRTITVDGHAVHVWERGSGPTIILLHGAGGNLRDFTFAIAPRLAETHHVIAFDRPGLGLSDGLGRDRQSPAEQAALLSQAARQMGVERAVIVGHSYGGAVAMAWALDHPDQAAAVVSLAGAVQPWEGGLGGFYAVLSSPISGPITAAFIANLIPTRAAEAAVESIFAPDPVPPGYIDHVAVGLTLQTSVLQANAQQVNTLLPHVTAMASRYRGLAMPLEIIHGSADTTVPLQVHSEPLAAQVPGANLTVLDGVGHMPHHADPDAAIAAITRAVDRAGLR